MLSASAPPTAAAWLRPRSQSRPDPGQAAGVCASTMHMGEVPEGAGPSGATTPEATEGWRKRWTIIGMCFMAFMLCNMDRVNMSMAILPMKVQFGWSNKIVGLVQSSFFWGYLLTQVLGGIWADKIGGKPVLGFGVLWWSVATVITPWAAQTSLPMLLAARAMMGIGEGVAMPAMNNLLSKWVPSMERSRSLALVYSGMFIGSTVGLGASPSIISNAGWPCLFYFFGMAGVVWYLVWQRIAASAPSQDPAISKAEAAFIADNTYTKPEGDESTAIPWALLLSRREVWAIIISHFCHNWGTFILLTWMPTYYQQVLGFDLMQTGVCSVLPWVVMAISANVGGWIADSMVTRGVEVGRVRKTMQSIGFLGPAVCLTLLKTITSPWQAVACMCISQGLDAFSQSGLYSNHQDIGPRYSGVLLGMSNTAGVLAGVLGTAATGYFLETGGWSQVWSVSVGLYLVGTLVFLTMSTGKRIFD